MPFWKRSKKDKKDRKESSANSSDESSRRSSDLTSTSTFIDIRDPIRVSDLPSKIEYLKNPVNSTSGLTGSKVEFEYMEALKATTVDPEYLSQYCPTSLKNPDRNRYGNVLAFEETRVKLKKPSPPTDSDYVNANWVGGLLPGTQKQYIAAQGPLENTIGDFWQMIAEQDSSVIIMLTRLIENGRNKCAKYYPEPGEIFQLGEVTVTGKEVDETEEVTTRKFILTHEGNQREVLQFHFTAWPDYGIPSSAQSFLLMMQEAEEANNKRTKGPFVVHCSAGIGRSGTFCAVHSVLQKYQFDKQNNPSKEATLEICEAILSLRLQRIGMVQAEEQYLFIFIAIGEAVENLKVHKQISKPKGLVKK